MHNDKKDIIPKTARALTDEALDGVSGGSGHGHGGASDAKHSKGDMVRLRSGEPFTCLICKDGRLGCMDDSHVGVIDGIENRFEDNYYTVACTLHKTPMTAVTLHGVTNSFGEWSLMEA